LAAGALVVFAIGRATHGWSSVADVATISILAVAAPVMLGRTRQRHTGVLVRRELDERQAYRGRRRPPSRS
jgi:hypothetical protein